MIRFKTLVLAVALTHAPWPACRMIQVLHYAH